MDNIWVWVLVGVVVLVVILIRNYLLRKTYTKKIMKAMSEEDYDRFYHILDSFWCKFALHPADREMMRLSAVLSQGDTAKIEDQINLMLHMRMKKKRKAAVAMQGFYFYVEMKNRRKADKMISIVQENAGPQSAKELKMIASVLLRTAFACFVNSVITLPLYAAAMGVSLDSVITMVSAVNPAITSLTSFVILATIPFNILKLGLNYFVGYLLYNRLHAIYHEVKPA